MNLPTGLSLTLWSHDETPYALSPVTWDPSSLTGIAAGSGSELLGVSPDTADSTLAQVSNDGAEIGAIIDSNDLLDGGTVPDGPMPLTLEWVAPKSIMPFANSTDQGLLFQADIQVPYVMQPGFQSTVTSAQIVLYLDLRDTTTGVNLAYGLTVFDSRGTSAPYFGVDDGTGGTGATIVTVPAGQTSPYDVLVPGTAAFQGGPWTGWQTFALMITPATLEAAIAAANAGNPGTNLSTNVANYELTNVSVDAELEYFGQANTFSYSVSNFQVAEVQDPASVTVAMLPPVVEVPPRQTPQQAAATPISGISLSESGGVAGETFTVALSDSYGDLSVNATGVTLGGLGNNSTDLTITGSLSVVNAALATLSDTDAVAQPDTITLSANDSFGNSSVQQQITVDPTALLTNVQVPPLAGAPGPAPCFLRGTRILTERGEIPVEALRAGEDRVITRDGRPAQVVWIGWRELDGARHPRPQDVMPVRVLAGALAPGQPRRDLRLSPDHALALGGVLIPVRYLLNGATVVQEARPGRIAYYHVELDRHDILLAEGTAAESYLDTGNRGAFTEGAGATQPLSALRPRRCGGIAHLGRGRLCAAGRGGAGAGAGAGRHRGAGAGARLSGDARPGPARDRGRARAGAAAARPRLAGGAAAGRGTCPPAVAHGRAAAPRRPRRRSAPARHRRRGAASRRRRAGARRCAAGRRLARARTRLLLDRRRGGDRCAAGAPPHAAHRHDRNLLAGRRTGGGAAATGDLPPMSHPPEFDANSESQKQSIGQATRICLVITKMARRERIGVDRQASCLRRLEKQFQRKD